MSMDQKKSVSEESMEIVPTVDVIRFSFLTSLLLLNKHPVLLTGKNIARCLLSGTPGYFSFLTLYSLKRPFGAFEILYI